VASLHIQQHLVTPARSFISALPLLLLLLLSACSQNSPLPSDSSTLRPTAELSPINEWQITAKLGIRSSEDSGSVTVKWSQLDDDYTIRVSGPLGQGNGIITGNSSFIRIERPNKEAIISMQPDHLIASTLGWQLPITLLPYWVQGHPNPTLPITKTTVDTQGVLTEIKQAGWQLLFFRHGVIEGKQVPLKIIASKDDVKLTFIIRSWQFVTQ